jgi:catechol 2,3-dioxygenase-like lactoylglutathione lyase family enzyme
MRDLTDTDRALASSSLVAFVGVCDPDRAKSFYRDRLGLRLVSEELPFALVFDVQGTMLRVTVVPEVKPAKFTVLGWKVPDIQAAVSSLAKAGVEFQRYAGLQQDGLGIWTSPNGGRVAWFHDPDGNILSVTQF